MTVPQGFAVSPAQEKSLRDLDLAAERTGVTDPVRSLDMLIEGERARRGVPDATGAFHAMALTQGSLLKNEYDLSTHAHHAAWTVGLVMVDPIRTIALNMRYGFPVGDAALRAVVAAMKAALPGAKVVRIHTDGFAALLTPSSGLTLEPSLRRTLPPALGAAVRLALPDDGEPPPELGFTVALSRLAVRGPSHWQVLGPVVWAEAERALAQQKRVGGEAVEERFIAMDAAIPTGR